MSGLVIIGGVYGGLGVLAFAYLLAVGDGNTFVRGNTTYRWHEGELWAAPRMLANHWPADYRVVDPEVALGPFEPVLPDLRDIDRFGTERHKRNGRPDLRAVDRP